MYCILHGHIHIYSKAWQWYRSHACYYEFSIKSIYSVTPYFRGCFNRYSRMYCGGNIYEQDNAMLCESAQISCIEVNISECPLTNISFVCEHAIIPISETCLTNMQQKTTLEWLRNSTVLKCGRAKTVVLL